MNQKNILLTTIIVMVLTSIVHSTVVEENGKLSVRDGKIINQHGDPVQLNGMSLFWSQWYGNFYNKHVVEWLVKDWKINVIRAAMAVHRGGYLEHKERERKKVHTVVKSAIDAGIYVIIDWHVELADPNVEESKVFFSDMAETYAGVPNVIFEPYNEPAGGKWKETKAYHTEIVKAIRQHSENLIIQGTPTWSQDLDVAARDPVPGEDLVYALHFYSSTHGKSLRDKAEVAMKLGIAVFITEWGTCSSTGNGEVDLNSAKEWMSWANKHMIGSTNWGIYDKNESCASIVTGRSDQGGWGLDDLTKSGKWMRTQLRNGIENFDNPETPQEEPKNDPKEEPKNDPKEDPKNDPKEDPKNDPKEDPKEEPKKEEGAGKTYDCCSWNAGISCGKHSDWCSISKKNCTRFCNGSWISAPGAETKEELEIKKDRKEHCCSWDNGNTCPKPETSWCNAKKNRCEGNCNGKWVPKKA